MSPKFLPPEGYTYQGIHGDSNGPRLLVATFITLSFAIVAVSLRMIVKLLIVPSVVIEDYFAIVALLLAIARSILLAILEKRHQYGFHIWDIQKDNFDFVYTRVKIATIIYLASIMFAKLSILLLYKRLFGIHRSFRYLCYALMGIVVSYCTAVILANVFQCKPIHAGWNFFFPGDCLSLQDIAIATGALNIATDFAIVVAPIPLVLKLQVAPAKLVGLLAVFSTGLFVVAVAIVREVEVVAASSHYDVTWTDMIRTLWLSVELHVGIICTCLPVLGPLMKGLPGWNDYKNRYSSAMSAVRGSRRKSGSRLLHDAEAATKSESGGPYGELRDVGYKAPVRTKTISQFASTESPW